MTTVEFMETYDRMAEAVLRYVGRQVLDAEVAADITAETFAQALEGRDRYDDQRGTIDAWLFGIAHNLVRHYFRHQRVARSARQSLGMPDRAVDDSDADLIDALLDLRDFQPRLTKAMDDLGESQRSAIQGRIVEGHTYADLAEAAGESEQVIRARVSRGLRAMAIALSEPHEATAGKESR